MKIWEFLPILQKWEEIPIDKRPPAAYTGWWRCWPARFAEAGEASKSLVRNPVSIREGGTGNEEDKSSFAFGVVGVGV